MPAPGSAARALAPAPPPDVVAARVAALRVRIEEAGRDPAGVRIVAVTKGFTSSAVDAARAAGLYDIGENYANEFLAKVAAVAEPSSGAPETRWHYLGAVQRRRVRALAPVVSCWQTLCRVAEGETIARHAPGAVVLVEVETTAIPGRNGCKPSEVAALVASLRASGLDVRGLMTVGPPGPPEGSRGAFRVTAALAHDLGLSEVSMGMTDDLEVALSEGSTMVRVGRALFGERPVPPA
ncbi:MAG TPA: alanine racemase [Acidimicrobiales bacterium]|nr:alanine racemase [Acidimicrobiales bacterium]